MVTYEGNSVVELPATLSRFSCKLTEISGRILGKSRGKAFLNIIGGKGALSNINYYYYYYYYFWM